MFAKIFPRMGGNQVKQSKNKDSESMEGVLERITFNNCAKKASADLKSFIKKTKAGNKECPFSGKPAKKKVQVAFCCGNCVGKASS